MTNPSTPVTSGPETEDTAFDSVEIIGHVVPLLFAIIAVVVVATAPDNHGKASTKPEAEQRAIIEQIHQKR